MAHPNTFDFGIILIATWRNERWGLSLDRGVLSWCMVLYSCMQLYDCVWVCVVNVSGYVCIMYYVERFLCLCMCLSMSVYVHVYMYGDVSICLYVCVKESLWICINVSECVSLCLFSHFLLIVCTCHYIQNQIRHYPTHDPAGSSLQEFFHRKQEMIQSPLQKKLSKIKKIIIFLLYP